MTKTNEQHQFDLLYRPPNVFQGSKYKYILTGVDVTSRQKVARDLRIEKASKIEFMLEATYKNSGMFKYPKVFQCNNGFKFKRDITKLLEKHNIDV